MSKTMILRPRISEKAYGLSQQANTYVFSVPKSANRLGVALAVSMQYGVAVEDVRLATVKGKVKQSYHKRRRPVSGKRSDTKRAYVQLKKGDKLPIFAQEEEKQAEVDKKAAKEAKKEKK